jgi:uncharacterized protein YndB with AHSA1/START domain
MTMNLDLRSLQIVLDGETDIILRRDFSHSAAKVWRAMTEPALIRQWMAAGDHPMTRCEIDPRPGGTFHYEWAGPDGNSFFFSGPVVAADPPHHMTHIEYFNGDTSSGATVITDLVASGTGSRMTMVMRFKDAEARAAAIATGMTDGMEEVYAKLESLPLDG